VAGANRDIGNQKIGDNDGREIGGNFYFARIKGIKTVNAAKIKITGAAAQAGVAIKFVALQAVGCVKVFNLVGAGIEAGQATV